MKVSWIILTYNREEAVEQALSHNLLTSWDKADEIIHVDNGSTDGVADIVKDLLKPDVIVRHKENLGVAKGYNRAMALATGDFIVITGCDMLMPNDWLKTFKDYFKAIPNTAVASMYQTTLNNVPERIRGERTEVGGLPIVPAMPMGRKMYSRDFLKKVGFLREDFGLYGWEDVEWGLRAERVAKEQGLLTYVIPDAICKHLGKTMDSPQYKEWKQQQAQNKQSLALMEFCRVNNYPYYNPYL